MKDVAKYIEGRMDEDYLYSRIMKNAILSLLLLVIACSGAWLVNRFVIPSVTTGNSGWYIAYVVATIAVFIYVFKPKTWLERSSWVLNAVAFSTIMYLTGECIVIAIVILGLLVALVCVFGEIFFTGALTYRDLTRWIKLDKLRIENEENAKKILPIENTDEEPHDTFV